MPRHTTNSNPDGGHTAPTLDDQDDPNRPSAVVGNSSSTPTSSSSNPQPSQVTRSSVDTDYGHDPGFMGAYTPTEHDLLGAHTPPAAATPRGDSIMPPGVQDGGATGSQTANFRAQNAESGGAKGDAGKSVNDARRLDPNRWCFEHALKGDRSTVDLIFDTVQDPRFNPMFAINGYVIGGHWHHVQAYYCRFADESVPSKTFRARIELQVASVLASDYPESVTLLYANGGRPQTPRTLAEATLHLVALLDEAAEQSLAVGDEEKPTRHDEELGAVASSAPRRGVTLQVGQQQQPHHANDWFSSDDDDDGVYGAMLDDDQDEHVDTRRVDEDKSPEQIIKELLQGARRDLPPCWESQFNGIRAELADSQARHTATAVRSPVTHSQDSSGSSMVASRYNSAYSSVAQSQYGTPQKVPGEDQQPGERGVDPVQPPLSSAHRSGVPRKPSPYKK